MKTPKSSELYQNKKENARKRGMHKMPNGMMSDKEMQAMMKKKNARRV